jgi:ribosome maturation factor RimP
MSVSATARKRPERRHEDGGQGPAVGSTLLPRVEALAAPILQACGVTLDRTACTLAGRRLLIQVFIDKPGGVDVEDCANVSRQLSATLDLEDAIGGAYVLEVSSPGLTRPLHGEADFHRFAGRLAEVKTRQAIEGNYTFVGRLAGVEDGAVVLVEEGSGLERRIRLEHVTKARLEIETTANGQGER